MKMVKTLSSFAVIFSSVMLVGGLVTGGGAGAMTAQDTVDVQFSFDESLGITLSSGSLIIENLLPGNYSYSNTITATVNTNNIYGYTLSAMVGGVGQTAANNTLYNSVGDTSFTSLATNASTLLADFQDNQWGYTTSSSLSGASYSGLAYNVDKTLNRTVNHNGTPVTGYHGTNATSFTIGAKASSDQLAGEYSNTITFTAVSNIATDFTINDITYMQDFAKLTSDEKASVLVSMTTDAQYTLIDSRDGKQYFVSKLQDGNVWMTQNLDLNLETSATNVAALDSTNTDITQYGANGYDSANGYNCSNATANCEGGTITWTPERATIPDGQLTADKWVNENGYHDPYSYTRGTTVVDGNNAYEGHKYVGTYYNWTAAIASNDSSSFTSNTMSNVNNNPQNSICPKGWRLPTISNESGEVAGSTNEFRRLNVLYNANVTDDATNLMNAPLYFTRSGYVSGGVVSYPGGGAYYWSSTVSNSNNAYLLYFYATGIGPESGSNRYDGFSVRCVAR